MDPLVPPKNDIFIDLEEEIDSYRLESEPPEGSRSGLSQLDCGGDEFNILTRLGLTWRMELGLTWMNLDGTALSVLVEIELY